MDIQTTSKPKIVKGIDDKDHEETVHSLITVFNRHHQLQNTSHNHDTGNSPDWLKSIEKILSRTNSTTSTGGATLFSNSSKSLPPLPPSQDDESFLAPTVSQVVSSETNRDQILDEDLFSTQEPVIKEQVSTSTNQKKLLSVAGQEIELDQ